MSELYIKCKKEKQYEKVRLILSLHAINYFQKEKEDPIKICDLIKKGTIKKIFEDYGFEKYKFVEKEPVFSQLEYPTFENLEDEIER